MKASNIKFDFVLGKSFPINWNEMKIFDIECFDGIFNFQIRNFSSSSALDNSAFLSRLDRLQVFGPTSDSSSFRKSRNVLGGKGLGKGVAFRAIDSSFRSVN